MFKPLFLRSLGVGLRAGEGILHLTDLLDITYSYEWPELLGGSSHES